jgi:4-amino-4-deoxy-L-arabinose transferase-like glycosyltransferase
MIKWVVILSLVLSLGYSFFYQIDPVVDARAYDQIAQNILAGRGFVEDSSKDILFDHAIVRAGPAYEYLLAFIYRLFGHRLEAVWVIQAIFHALTAYLIFLICQLVFKENGAKIGLLAAAFIGFHPDLIEISAMLMTETFYIFLVTATIFYFVKIYNEPRNNWNNAVFGAIFSLTVLSRPPALLFLPVFLAFYFLKRHFMQAIIFLVLLLMVLAPWMQRNYKIYNQFIPTTLIGEYNLWVGNTSASTGGQIAGGFNAATDYAEKNGYLNFKKEARNYFRNFIIERPLEFAKLVGLRIVRYFSLIRPMGFWFYQSGFGQGVFVLASLAAIAFLFVAGFSGLKLAWKERNEALNYLIILAVTAPVALLPAAVESRYRFQIYPFLALFAGYFLLKWREDRLAARRALWQAGAFLLLISAIDLAAFWPTVYERIQLFI